MKPGSTPLQRFELPFHSDELAVAFVSYVQDGAVVIEKRLQDFAKDGNTVYYRLTQEETLRFKEGRPGHMQFDFRSTTGIRIPSDFIPFTVGRTVKKEVI